MTKNEAVHLVRESFKRNGMECVLVEHDPAFDGYIVSSGYHIKSSRALKEEDIENQESLDSWVRDMKTSLRNQLEAALSQLKERE